MLRKSKMPPKMGNGGGIDSTAVSIFVVVLVELTNTVFVNSTNISTHIETAVPPGPATFICQASHYHLTWCPPQRSSA